MEEEQSIKIGHVVSISGALISSIIEEECSSEAVQFGALVTVPAAGAEIFGLINNLRTDTGTDGRERRLFDIELLGEPVKDSMFERGVSIYPTLGASVYIAAAGDLAKVYARPDVETVQFGTIHQDRALPASPRKAESTASPYVLSANGPPNYRSASFAMQHVVRPAHEQRARSGFRPQRSARKRPRLAEFFARASHAGSHRRRRRRNGADAHPLQRPGAGTAAAKRRGFVCKGLARRPYRRRLRRRNDQALAAPSQISLYQGALLDISHPYSSHARRQCANLPACGPMTDFVGHDGHPERTPYKSLRNPAQTL